MTQVQFRTKSAKRFSKVNINTPVAKGLALLTYRREHGVHISALGGLDGLAELSWASIPFEARAFPERGTGRRQCWIVTDAQIFVDD